MDGLPLAVNATRAAPLRAASYHVLTRMLPVTITQKNRLPMGSADKRIATLPPFLVVLML
ncbi:hypothetical protein DSCA_39770 [Desulfosarcina alkanivorans]|uniref:Uncharacterized protein n=1 Tax=Desulfosarcina alkanivorans TaxID=571177 RepID=A0A5K7YZK8_9BACT|nr:hypothetical protein DSCA_39770 [Desulfosarcina alkanivorans]